MWKDIGGDTNEYEHFEWNKKGRIQSLAGGTKTCITVLTLNFSISYTIQFGNTKLYKTHRKTQL